MKSAICSFLALSLIIQTANAQGLRETEEAKIEAEVTAALDGLKDERLRRVADILLNSSRLTEFSAKQATAGSVGRLISYQTFSESRPTQNNKYARTSRSERDTSVRISQVLDKDSVLVADFDALVDGIDTSGMTDDSPHDFSRYIVECRGTKQYETNFGTRTVKHFVCIDPEKMNRVLKEVNRIRSFRVWLDKNEKHATRAQFVDFKNGKVTLLSQDGKEISVKIVQLSKTDQAWVRAALKW